VVNPRDIDAPFMNIAFDSTALARETIPAALHPADHTCRPQFVRAEQNRQYHDLLKKFESRTGIGAVLNTSFNLHGHPIVCSPEDALYTLLHSGLDYLSMDRYLVERR
jgi:carbamoyltransferase